MLRAETREKEDNMSCCVRDDDFNRP